MFPLSIPVKVRDPISLSPSYQHVISAEASPSPVFLTCTVITRSFPSLGLELLKSICVISRSASAVTILRSLRITLPLVLLDTENLVSAVVSESSVPSTRLFSLVTSRSWSTMKSTVYSIFNSEKPTLPSVSLVTVSVIFAISTPYSSTKVSSLSMASCNPSSIASANDFDAPFSPLSFQVTGELSGLNSPGQSQSSLPPSRFIVGLVG